MKRPGWRMGAALGVLGAVAWLVLAARTGSEGLAPRTSRMEASHGSELLRPPRLTSGSERAPGEATLAIRGTVLGPRGPVAGARVLASFAVPGESLSTLRCGDWVERTLFECLYGETERHVVELVEERRGEAIVRAQTVTAADGSFSVSGLEEGSYALWVESVEGIAFRPSVAAGAEPVELRLGAGVRLSGTVTDEDKALVPGALVTVIVASHSRFFEALTDAQGRYELGPLPPGQFMGVIVKKGLFTALQPFAAYSPEVNMDFTLARPWTITGRVLSSKAPVAGAEVVAIGTADLEDQALSALTDAAGRFSFEGLRSGSYELRARHGGRGASGTVSLGEEGASSDVMLELQPAVFIEGVVRDEDQQPIPQADVQASWVEQDDFEAGEEGDEAQGDEAEGDEAEGDEAEGVNPGWVVASTDAEGRYRLGPLPAGWYSFKISAEPYLDLEEEPRRFTAGESTRDFTLKRALLVEGILVDSQGRPVRDEGLRLRPPVDTEEEWHYGMTGADGHFSLAVSRPGEYLLGVEGLRVHPLEMTVRVPTQPLRIVGEPLLRLTGEVVDELGMPLPGVEVAVWTEKPAREDRSVDSEDTDGEGRFVLRVRDPGRYLVTAELTSRNFLRTASQAVELDGREEPRVRLRFEQGHRLPGVVVNWRGRPMPKIGVRLRAAPRTLLRKGDFRAWGVETDAEGRFAFQQVSGDQFDACIQGGDYVLLESLPGDPGCTRVKNDGQELRLVVGREVFVTGRVVHPDGAPVTHFSVNGREQRREDGEFSILIHRPGEERIELAAPGLGTVQRIAPDFTEGEVIQDLGAIELSP